MKNPAAKGSMSGPGSLVLVRHARTDMANHRPETWRLADDASDDARRLGLALRTVISERACTVVCSTEPKALETAVALGVGAVRSDERLREVERRWYDDRREFEGAVHGYLSGAVVSGWEPIDDAVARFGSVITELGGGTVVVSHGTVMSAWLDRQIPDLGAVAFWDDLEMPDAWFVDLDARSVHRIAVHEGPDPAD